MHRAVFVAVIGAAIAACSPPSAGYPASYRTNFMNSCTGSAGQAAQCACVWDGIEKEIPRADFEAMERTVASGQDHPLVQRIREISAACHNAQATTTTATTTTAP